jgi:hypothetical protein
MEIDIDIKHSYKKYYKKKQNLLTSATGIDVLECEIRGSTKMFSKSLQKERSIANVKFPKK